MLKITKKVENQTLLQSADELARNPDIHRAESKGTWKQREVAESALSLGHLPTLLTLSSSFHCLMEPRRQRHSTGQPKWHIPEDPLPPKLGPQRTTPFSVSLIWKYTQLCPQHTTALQGRSPSSLVHGRRGNHTHGTLRPQARPYTLCSTDSHCLGKTTTLKVQCSLEGHCASGLLRHLAK